MADANAYLREIIKYLVAANTTLPVIVDTIAGIALLIKGATGIGPSVRERAEIIRAQVAENAAFGADEIARLDAMIAARDSATGTDD